MRHRIPPTGATLHSSRWKLVEDLATEYCHAGILTCAAITTGTADSMEQPLHVGRQHPDQPSPLRNDAIFLVASITKPIVAMGVMLLIERGQLTLADRVTDFIPEFGQNGKHGVEIRHLLTHTSGLPDMLLDNTELRQSHASLTRFLERTCEEPLAFPPGRSVQYQSMGFVVLGEIIARLTGMPCGQFLKREFFGPLEMNDTTLGVPDEWFSGTPNRIDRIPSVQLPAEHVDGPTWNWNSPYWRRLGAPWGGLLTTVSDLGAFAQFLLRSGTTRSGRRLLAPATIAAATHNQLMAMRDVPDIERRCRPWGLGWRLNWPAHSANFGDLLGPNTYGHWGATGTVLWIDPDQELFAVILTTTPQEPAGRFLSRLSNTIAAAWF